MAAPTGRITVDEVGRRIERVEGEVQDGFRRLNERLDQMNYVHPETLDTKLMLEQAHRQDLERRVAQLESNNLWLWRAFAGAIIVAIVTGLLVSAGMPS